MQLSGCQIALALALALVSRLMQQNLEDATRGTRRTLDMFADYGARCALVAPSPVRLEHVSFYFCRRAV